MNLIPLPAFQDNDLWMLHDGRRALVVDPGDAQPVLACLQRDGLQLEAILVAHHHPDHIGGVSEPREATGAAVYGPAREQFARAVEPHDNERVHYLKRREELRAQNPPTLPATIAQDKRINPFLRTRLPGAARAARAHDGTAHQDDVAVFAALRQCKNEFK
jgi:glyoxylase-like metal-dependent hydrolase (beta-lactamase superfamily II)